MLHNGKHVWADSDEGETPAKVCLAVAAAAVCLAPAVDDEDGGLEKLVDLKELRRYVKNGNELFLLVHAGRNCQVHLEPTPGKADEYDLNLQMYEGDPSRLLDTAAAIIDALNSDAGEPDFRSVEDDEVDLDPDDVEIELTAEDLVIENEEK